MQRHRSARCGPRSGSRSGWLSFRAAVATAALLACCQGAGPALAKPPVASAGPDRKVPPGVITLDGTASRHPAQAALSYQWSYTGGPAPCRLSSETVATPRVELVRPGLYTFGLRVYDAFQTSQLTEVAITVLDVPPTCGVGPDQQVPTGSVALTGWATDANRQPVTVSWSQTGGPRQVTLSDPSSPRTSFTVPGDGAGVYRFVLKASDGVNSTTCGPVQITVDDLPEPHGYVNPMTIAPGGKTELNGSGSTDKNPEDNPLTYGWAVASGPDRGTLTGADQPWAKFTATKAGTYDIQLTVRENKNGREAATRVQVKVKNVPPTASAGPAQTAHREEVALDGTGSSDENGDAVTYLWKQTEGPEQLPIADPTSPRPSVKGTKPGTYTFTLVVNDGENDSGPASTTVTLKNAVPVPIVPGAVTARPGPLMLNGAASTDPDADPIRYIWAQSSGPAPAPISGLATCCPTVVLTLPGTYVFELTVSDGVATSFPVRSLVIVGP
ncbi:MAG: hypothetical protein HY815_29840 [Candidatus Riflebacteria bacterium]|nr:hypothetical protein [Candidatus Riflebacteria bacterium]